MKGFDRVFALFALWLLLSFWLNVYLEPLFSALIAAFAIVGLALSLFFFRKRHVRKRRPSLSESMQALALMRAEEQREFFLSLFPPEADAERDGDFIRFQYEGKNMLALPAVRFQDLNKEDVAKVYRKWISASPSPDAAVIFGKNASREVMLFAASLPMRCTFLIASGLRLALLSKDALPALPKNKTVEKIKIRIDPKELAERVFDQKRAKYFFLSGLLLLLLSFFTPLKVYYLGMATIPLIFGVICTFYPAIRRN